MQKFFDNVVDKNGHVLAGASVTVTDAATGALSTIYSNNSLGIKANPIACDSNGYFEFYAANGRYNIDVTGAGLHTRHVTDVLLEDITGTGADLVQLNQNITGHFFANNGARVDRMADRVLMGAAVAHAGTDVVSQTDWLTVYQLAKGRAGGSIMFAQSAILNDTDTRACNTFVTGAHTANLSAGFNGIGVTSIAVNDGPLSNVGAYAGYYEAYRGATSAGGAYGIEIDTINYAGAITIDPYQQFSGQSIALQLASGGQYPTAGQFSGSAAINIRSNGQSFDSGIVFGMDSIAGTDGVTGTGNAIKLAKGHAIQWFKGTGSPTGGIVCTSTTSAGAVLQVFDQLAVTWLNNSGKPVFQMLYQAADVNYLRAASSAAGSRVLLTAQGDDTNIDLALVPKGAGLLWLGSWTSNADAAVNGFITVKDAAGTTRKLATIA